MLLLGACGSNKQHIFIDWFVWVVITIVEYPSLFAIAIGSHTVDNWFCEYPSRIFHRVFEHDRISVTWTDQFLFYFFFRCLKHTNRYFIRLELAIYDFIILYGSDHCDAMCEKCWPNVRHIRTEQNTKQFVRSEQFYSWHLIIECITYDDPNATSEQWVMAVWTIWRGQCSGNYWVAVWLKWTFQNHQMIFMEYNMRCCLTICKA